MPESSSRRLRFAAALLLSLGALSSPPAAHAAEGFEAEPFRPMPDTARSILDVAAPGVGPVGTWSATLLLDHVDDPLRRNAEAPTPYEPRGTLLARPTVLHFLGNYALTDRIALGADIPFVVHQHGDAEVGLASPEPLEGTGFGDIRLVPQLLLLETAPSDLGRIAVSLLPEVTLPTGDREQFHGGGLRFSPRAALGWETSGGIRLAANAGYTFRDEVDVLGLEARSGINWGMGVLVPIAPALRAMATATHDLATEGSLAVATRIWNVELLAGMATGLTDDEFTPAWRAFGGVSFALDEGMSGTAYAASVDRDGDGILDDRDACPLEPEDFDGFQDDDGCPDPDDDGDRIPDHLDACPREAEDFDGFEDEDGCPEDGGGPDDAAVPLAEELPDHDAGTVVAIDAVIYFDTGSDEIQPAGRYALVRVARTIRALPDHLIVWIEGHADDTGTDELNRALSERRAAAVQAYLVGQGVPRARLATRGYGKRIPAYLNESDLERLVNRRVEFHVAPRSVMDTRPQATR